MQFSPSFLQCPLQVAKYFQQNTISLELFGEARVNYRNDRSCRLLVTLASFKFRNAIAGPSGN